VSHGTNRAQKNRQRFSLELIWHNASRDCEGDKLNTRRKLMVVLGAGALAAPVHLLAQRVYRIAVLIQGTERTLGARFEALRAGLRELGYVEGKNLSISLRWNEGGLEQLPGLAAELLRDNPDVFVVAPVVTAAAAQKLSRSVPIVIASGGGVLKIGLAKSFAHPGGNVTGLENQGEELVQKHIELLKTIVPGISRLGVLNTGKYVFHDEAWRAAMQAAQVMKVTLIDVRVGAPRDLARIASICGKEGCGGLYVMTDPILTSWRAQVIEEAMRLRLPAVYAIREYAQEGGLISYSPDIEAQYRRAATYVDKILKGAKPGDLPIERPTTFELVVNMKTAKALGLTIPNSILVQATQVIE
jgi:putative ABC transport system substrate-binding protein